MTPRRPLRRLLAASVATTALLSGLAACGGGESSDGSATSGSTDAGSTSNDPPDSADGAPSDEPADSPAGGAVFVDVTESPAATVTIGEAGFDPSSVSVAVGEVVKFTSGDGGGVYGVVVGDLSGYTVSGGIDEYFRFDEPGTYQVTEEISEATMTVTAD